MLFDTSLLVLLLFQCILQLILFIIAGILFIFVTQF